MTMRADMPMMVGDVGRVRALRALVPIGRLFVVAIFLMSSMKHFSAEGIGYAASQGVPMANVLVPVSGILALAGGISVLLGYKARWGALLLAMFLVPVTLMMHRFWAIPDPQMAMMQQVMFMKNVSMLGATLLLMYFGAGPISFDNALRKKRLSSS